MRSNVNFVLMCGLLFLMVSVLAADLDVLMSPIEAKKGSEACLIFIDGAEISPQQYIPLLKQIQLQSSLKLWVGAPHFPLNTPNPLKLDEGINRVLTTLQSSGMNTTTIFIAGHSMGGAVVQTWTNENADLITGQILMGSFLTRVWKNKEHKFHYSVPTLTIGGELDGLARVTRFAEAFYTQITVASDPNLASLKFPVTVVRGLSHMQFASGDPPKLVFERDLLPELSNEEAHKQVAVDVVNYMDVCLGDKLTSLRALQARVSETREFVAPIVTSLKEEGYHNFLPPCLCSTDTCAEMANCTAGCPFTASVSQVTMGGLQGGVDNTDSFHDVWETKPTVHLPVVQNSCQEPNGCILKTTTITQAVYHTGEDLEIWKKHFDVSWLDSDFFPLSAVELRTKMSSRENIHAKSGLPADFDELDGGAVRCGEINQKSIDWAYTTAAPSTVARFSAHGQPYKVVADVDVCPAGPCWIWEELHYKESADGSVVELSSPQFSTALNFPLPKTQGFHYCKVLSPARAVEWLYVDGLRAKYSLKSHSTAVKQE